MLYILIECSSRHNASETETEEVVFKKMICLKANAFLDRRCETKGNLNLDSAVPTQALQTQKQWGVRNFEKIQGEMMIPLGSKNVCVIFSKVHTYRKEKMCLLRPKQVIESYDFLAVVALINDSHYNTAEYCITSINQ